MFTTDQAAMTMCSDACRKEAARISARKYHAKQVLKKYQGSKPERPEGKFTTYEYQHNYYVNVIKPKRAAKRAEAKQEATTPAIKPVVEPAKTYYGHPVEVEPVKTATKIVKTPVVDSDKDIVIETLNKTILDNLELLDEVRTELQNVQNELRARQSAYDQKDAEMLHAFEGTTDENKLLELAKQCKDNRKNRRNYKNYISFLNNILKVIPLNLTTAYKNIDNIQRSRDTFYSIKY